MKTLSSYSWSIFLSNLLLGDQNEASRSRVSLVRYKSAIHQVVRDGSRKGQERHMVGSEDDGKRSEAMMSIPLRLRVRCGFLKQTH